MTVSRFSAHVLNSSRLVGRRFFYAGSQTAADHIRDYDSIETNIREEWKSHGSHGRIRRIQNGVVTIEGFQEAKPGMILMLGDVRAFVMRLNAKDKTTTLCAINFGDLRIGQEFKIVPDFNIPFPATLAGPGMIGRTVDALGNILSSEEEDYDEKTVIPIPIFNLPKNRRHPLERTQKRLHTGIKALDMFFPIGRGRRISIVGDDFQRKSELAIDIACGLIASHPEEERGLDVIYVSVGKHMEECQRLEDLLQRSGMIDWTTVIRATDRDTMAMQYLSVYAGIAMADFHRARGRHVLLINDNLSNHNNVTAKLMRDGHGLTTYGNYYGPMLDRCGHYKKSYGGGSITHISVADPRDDRAETMYYFLPHLTGAVDTVIPMNSETYEKGIFPAISLIPVPFGAPAFQKGALRELAAGLRDKIVNGVLNHNQAEAQAEAGFELEDLDLEDDDRFIELLKIRRMFTQTQATDFSETVIIMFALNDGAFLERIHLGKLHQLESRLLQFFRSEKYPQVEEANQLLAELDEDSPMSLDLELCLRKCVDLFLVDNSDLSDFDELAIFND